MARASSGKVSDVRTGQGISPDFYDEDDPRYDVAKREQEAREAEEKGGEDVSPGTSSSPSGESKTNEAEKSETQLPKPARSTARR